MNAEKIIPRAQCPPPTAPPDKGRPARILALAIEAAKSSSAVSVSVLNAKAGYHLLGKLREVAKKEGLEVNASKDPEGTTFFYWIEERSKSDVLSGSVSAAG